MEHDIDTVCKTDVLFTLGAISRHREWLDYSKLDFEPDDIPALIDLLSRHELRQRNEPTLVHEFAPIHAWRILGQLKHPDAITPLIELFPSFNDNDWAISELPEVFGMIGRAAVKPLSNYVLDLNHAESSRVLAMDSLFDIANSEYFARDEILAVFKSLVGHAMRQSKGFNASLVINLIDLQEEIFIEDIRDLYKRDLVDKSIAGDIEEIEELWHLGNFHIQPLPDFPGIRSVSNSGLPPNDMSTTLTLCFKQYAHARSLKNIHQLDGFVTALACSPNTISPSVWLPAIWGGENCTPAWTSESEKGHYLGAIILYQAILTQNMRANSHQIFAALGSEHLQIKDWCHGFIHGVRTWGNVTSTQRNELINVLEKMSQCIELHPNHDYENSTSEQASKLKQQIETSVWRLYQSNLDK